MTIAEIIKQIVKEKNFIGENFVCRVSAVSDRTCDVEVVLTDAPISDVRLNVAGEDIVIKPKRNSYVMVSRINNSDYYVSAYSEIESIDIKASDKIVFNEGKNGGIMKIENVVDWMDKVHADLTSLTTLLATINVVTGTPPITIGVGNVLFAPTTPKPIVKMFENEKIQH